MKKFRLWPDIIKRIFENENKEAVEHIFPEKPTPLELGTKVMEMFEYKERYDGIIE